MLTSFQGLCSVSSVHSLALVPLVECSDAWNHTHTVNHHFGNDHTVTSLLSEVIGLSVLWPLSLSSPTLLWK